MFKKTITVFVLSCLGLLANAQSINMDKAFQAIEKKYHVTVNAAVIDTNTGKTIGYRENDRVPFQSTFKFLGVAALLNQDQKTPLLNKTVTIKPKDLVPWHPISGQFAHQKEGLKIRANGKVTLKILAKGAVSYSDNTAINKIVDTLGGPKKINHFAQVTGNMSFNLVHDEPHLNSNPNNDDDTATPKDMATSVHSILLGGLKDNLSNQHKALLILWLRNNTTGYQRIRAGMPIGWVVADKTGSGSYGVANDIGMVWSPNCKPIILSIYTHQQVASAKPNDKVIADVTATIMKELARHNACMANS